MNRAASAWQIVLSTLDVENAMAVLCAMLHAPALLQAVQPAADLVRVRYFEAADRAIAWANEHDGTTWRSIPPGFHAHSVGAFVASTLKTQGLPESRYMDALNLIMNVYSRDCEHEQDPSTHPEKVMVADILRNNVHVSVMHLLQGRQVSLSHKLLNRSSCLLFDFLYAERCSPGYARMTRELERGMQRADIPLFFCTCIEHMLQHRVRPNRFFVLSTDYFLQSAFQHTQDIRQIPALVEDLLQREGQVEVYDAARVGQAIESCMPRPALVQLLETRCTPVTPSSGSHTQDCTGREGLHLARAGGDAESARADAATGLSPSA